MKNDDDDDDGDDDGDGDYDDWGKVNEWWGVRGCPHYFPWHCQVPLHYALQYQCVCQCSSNDANNTYAKL